MRAGPSLPRRPFLLAPLALAACSQARPAADAPATDAPAAGDVLARRARALLAGDLDAAGAGYASADRDGLRRDDARAVAAGLDDWAVEGLQVDGARVRGVLRERVAGEGRPVAGLFRAGWDGSLHRGGGTPQPWELGDVTAQRAIGGVVLHVGGTGDVGRQAAADLADATARVDAAWGTDWPRGTAVVVVPTAADVSRLAGGPAADVDAVAVGLDADLADGRPAGVRVVLSTERFAALSPLGRTVTLTHELVHVATRATARAPGAVVPRWLTEGYADHVARRDRPVAASALAAALLAAPGEPQVPADADFTDPARVQVAYAAGWTLVTSAARVAGTPAVTAFVRATWTGTGVERACRQSLGRSLADVVRTWRADVASDLVGWGP
ncbi:hypothetical protein [Kineococcus rhizosphaerae]|uniref:Peptidase MA superfamily protein n=1 Tax=Kineococcus rhizosphaerae TaxID=559628 RepID=A0A2T0R8I9_9ACTN|nr:hypothetical protein [Kineococcus rhizosphaerae]PRY17487.1 hypothetical protein CLV37_102450 [Kineococcus rhizosphaerae]